MAWKKSSPEQIRRFDQAVAAPGAKRGLLFGCPVYTLDGERYATLYQGRIVLRLPPADIAALIAKGGRPFAPHKGRASKERVVLPEAIATNSRALEKWVARAVEFARVK